VDGAIAHAWGEWISGLGEWHLFGALTYDPRKVRARPGNAAVRRDVSRWLGYSPGHPSVFVEGAVLAIEYQRNEWPHVHPLLRLRGGLGPGAIRDLGQAWFQDHGYALLERPRQASAVASYAAKYLAKDLDRGDVIFWPSKGTLSSAEPALPLQELAPSRNGRQRSPLYSTTARV
jgi:hypothetical protein